MHTTNKTNTETTANTQNHTIKTEQKKEHFKCKKAKKQNIPSVWKEYTKWLRKLLTTILFNLIICNSFYLYYLNKFVVRDKLNIRGFQFL